ncbi:PQQ-dependent sugar dehydrogenase, partial [Flavobacteriaceae bacterium KMM 6898]|nr:PQQ-dependent sugar dehydrogenase [Flavobacteriaceae bacterium KMM 6898]
MGTNYIYRSALFFLPIIFFFGIFQNGLHAQLPTAFQKVDLVTDLTNSTTFKFAPDGRIFIADRFGELLIYKPATQTTVSAGIVPVFQQFEDGLLALAFDPDFSTNNVIYLYYSAVSPSVNRISQFSMNGDVLDLSSEAVLLEWPVQRTNSFHAGGDMDFDSQGNLYISIGDNTNHGNYGALDENNSNNSAEKSSSNTNDYRGKILRINPLANGSYSVPSGNLFPGGTGGLPEIYVMGARNPYRIFVDKENTDWLFWGEVGPDANTASDMGPEGKDEINLTKAAGNYGWPYFSGENEAYQVPYRSPPPSLYYNSPATPENISKWNTGATALPPAQPSWLDFFHRSYFAGPRYYYTPGLPDEQRLPVELDGGFFYYDFNTSKVWVVKMDATGSILSNDQLAPAVFPQAPNGFIDMKIGPDAHLYILEYGVGCCANGDGSGKLVRVDYTGISTNSPPNVVLNASPTNGALPLTVAFSSVGTSDPNGDSPLTYEWDFDTTVPSTDSTLENPSFTYTTAGTFNAQLRVDDGNGGIGVQNITIYAGNTAAAFTFNSPVDGGFIGWGDEIDFDLEVDDAEDGSISGGGVDCADVNAVPSLGHLGHFHDGATLDGCPKTITLDPGAHDTEGEMDIFYVLGTNYTDQGGLISFDQIRLHPKRREAEFYDIQSGVSKIANTDPLEGGSEAIRVDHDGYISFFDRNLLNITSVRYRIAAAATGGTIELRTGSATGPLLATTNVPVTGSSNTWVNVESNFTDPGDKNDLYFVFKNSPGQLDIFDLNYVEFIGNGVSVDNSPPEVNEVESTSSTEVRVEFSEYVDQNSAETTGNYTIDNGITISSVVLQPDNRTVLLATSPLSSGIQYNLQISNVENISGQPIVTDSYPFFTISSIRINTGGPQVVFYSENFIADQYFSGGSLYSATIPIAGTNDDVMYQTERYGNFSYEIPVPVSGDYDFRLHFAELYFGVGRAGGQGSRVFNVSIEGTPVLTNFDILSEVSPATALQKEFENISITDGFASIQFSSVIENPKISGIEIIPSNTVDPVPDITITSPSNGTNVNQPFQVNFTVENWTLQEGGTHVQYSIDGQLVAPHYNYSPITIDGLSLGSHSIRLELYDVGSVPTGIFHEISVNVVDQGVCNTTPFPDSWTVHQFATNPYTAVYTIPDFDLDGDGLKDIVTGGWWYKNPGSASGNWVKSTIGGGFGNVVHVHDFDGDGHMDLLGTALGSGSGNEYKSFQLLWAKNDGSGNFTVYTNIPAGNTTYSEPFLAGIAGGDFGLGSPYQMAINWNGAESTGSPVQLLTPPADPTTGNWTLVDISNDSSGEDIKVGDIDGDGDLDLFQGINWLRNEGNGSWTTFSTGVTYVTTPDRIQLADFNGDGRLDGAVGQLGLGSNPNRSEFSWFESPADPTQPWTRHILSTTVTGSLSVFAIDFDFDGDKDIIVGEWLGSRRLIAFENDLCNTGNWITHILDDGALNLEHHDGAMVTDIDNDGDLDVISNGWINHKVPRIYENTSLSPGNQDPLANAGTDQSIVLPANSITVNGTGSDPDGGAVTFLWTQTSGPNTATLSGTATADLTASNLVEGDYVFRLTVTDDENDTAFDEVGVTVLPEPTGGFALRINAGGPQTTYGG